MRVEIHRRRAAMMLVALLCGFLAMGVRLTYIQGVAADEYADLARKQRVRQLVLPAERGAIYDRNGHELALSIPARTVYANPRQIADPAATARAVAPLLELDPGEVEARLRQPRGFVYLARQVDVDRARAVEELRLVGIGAMNEPRRTYPGGALAAHITGFVGTDGEGLAGLEAAYEALLSGRPGYRVLEQDPHGRPIPQGMFQEQAPVAGADLVLTIDRDIQHAAEQALHRVAEQYGGKGGTIVVMRPQTGEILAMANAPAFDPNDVRRIPMEATRNRAVTDAYEPGSVNKVITAAAALEEGVVEPSTVFRVPSTINVGGTQFKDAVPHPTYDLSFADIIAKSSNVGTIQVALRLGPTRLTDHMARFGYGRATALGYPGESAGILPSAERWRTSLPTMAIGQGVSVTALQLVRAYAALANDGVAVEPQLVAGWVDSTGAYHAAAQPRRSRVVSAGTSAAMREIMERVVVSGTGTQAQIPGYSAGGKTGTAQKPSPRGGYQGYMASFFGVVPAGSPQLAIGVIIDDPRPYWGGVVAAPVFREVGQAAVRILRIPPTMLPEDVAPVDEGAARLEGPGIEVPAHAVAGDPAGSAPEPQACARC